MPASPHARRQRQRQRRPGPLRRVRTIALALLVGVAPVPAALTTMAAPAHAVDGSTTFSCETGGGTFTAPGDATKVHLVKATVAGAGGAGVGGDGAGVNAYFPLDGADSVAAIIGCANDGYHDAGVGGTADTGSDGRLGGGSSAVLHSRTEQVCEDEPNPQPPTEENPFPPPVIRICRWVTDTQPLVEAGGGGGAGGGVCFVGDKNGAGGVGSRTGGTGGKGGGAQDSGGDGGDGGVRTLIGGAGEKSSTGSCSGGGGGGGGGTLSGGGGSAGTSGAAGGGGGGGSSSTSTAHGITPRGTAYTSGWNPGGGVVQLGIVASAGRPTVVQQPQDVTALNGGEVGFEVHARTGGGYAPDVDRWLYSRDGGSTWAAVTNATHEILEWTELYDGATGEVRATIRFTARPVDHGTVIRAVVRPSFPADIADLFGDAADVTTSAATLTIAPGTTVVSGPSGFTGETSPSFTFGSDDADATFECRLDGPGAAEGAWTACTSTTSWSDLADGSYTFSARAKNAAGTVDPTPATRTFTVDTTAPQTMIDSGPSGLTNDGSPPFAFSATEDGSTFQCRLDGPGTAEGTWASCTSPASHVDLAEGSYTFSVRAADATGNGDATAATRSFTVDTTTPETTITSGPSGATNDAGPTFEFTSSESGSLFACRVDGPGLLQGRFGPCASPKTYSELDDGSYTLSVLTRDAAGNEDPTPATRSFTVDTTAPDTTISSGPAEDSWTSTTSATFGFEATEAGSMLACSLDGAAPAPCTSPADYSGLALGEHTFSVKATDGVGNTDPTPALRTWSVKAPTSLLQNGQQLVGADSTLLLGADLSSEQSGCTSGQEVAFSLGADPDGDGPATVALGTATTGPSGQATLSVPTAGWTVPAVHEVSASFAGTATCGPSTDATGTLAVSSPGDSARGGGWFTAPGSGRTNFSFVVGEVPHSDPQQFRGRLMLTNAGKWRLKGDLTGYARSGSSGSSAGTGDLYHWDAALNGGPGDWVLSRPDVTFTISYRDLNGSGGKGTKTADQFGILIDYAISSPNEPDSLPNTQPQDLRGGNVDVR